MVKRLWTPARFYALVLAVNAASALWRGQVDASVLFVNMIVLVAMIELVSTTNASRDAWIKSVADHSVAIGDHSNGIQKGFETQAAWLHDHERRLADLERGWFE